MMLSLGYSPCPNDCFIFYALVHNKIAHDKIIHGKTASPTSWQLWLEDVETLNQWGKIARLDVSKISYHAYAHLLDDYIMLRAGGALGRGVGPLLVSKQPNLQDGDVIAIPGGLTTANLLLKLWQPKGIRVQEYRYDLIMPAVVGGEVQAGLIIHESRFTYAAHGLHKILDLGTWWEQETNLPIPLGGIMARRSYDSARLDALNLALRASLRYAYDNRVEAQPYIAHHAQEMSPEVMQQHIDLYVNAYSFDVGNDGEAAVELLFEKARMKGIVPRSRQPLFHS